MHLLLDPDVYMKLHVSEMEQCALSCQNPLLSYMKWYFLNGPVDYRNKIRGYLFKEFKITKLVHTSFITRAAEYGYNMMLFLFLPPLTLVLCVGAKALNMLTKLFRRWHRWCVLLESCLPAPSL